MSETTTNKTWSYLMIAGAVLMLVATFLPAATIEIDLLGITGSDDASFDDMDDNSQLMLWLGFLLAAIGAALGLVESMAANAKYGGILSIVGGLLGLFGWFTLFTSISDMQDDLDVFDELLGTDTSVAMAIGGWIALLGALVAVVGGGLSAKDEFM